MCQGNIVLADDIATDATSSAGNKSNRALNLDQVRIFSRSSEEQQLSVLPNMGQIKREKLANHTDLLSY